MTRQLRAGFGAAASVVTLMWQTAVLSQELFEDVTSEAGFSYVGQSYGSSWGDFNGDGWPDLWVGNHANLPNLFVNQGDGTFVDVIDDAWPARNLADTHGAAWADFDNDGDQDLIEVVGSSQPTHLLVNTAGSLSERAVDYGVSFPGMRARTPAWLDWNRDGKLDLVIAHELGPTPFPTVLKNLGSTFLDATTETGVAESSRTAAYLADITEDGNTDVVFTNGLPNNGPIYDTSGLPFVAMQGSGAFPLYPAMAGCSDTVVADFNGDLRTDIFSSCGRGGRQVVQTSPTHVEMRMSSSANETAVELTTPGVVTVAVWPSFVFNPDLHLRVGAAGIVPETVSRPDLGWLAFTMMLDPADETTWGVPPHTPGSSLGLFVSYDPAVGKWQFALSGSAGLSMVLDSAAPISNVATIGFQSTPTASSPVYLLRTDGGFVDRVATSGLAVPLPCESVVGGDFDNDMDVDIYLECSRVINNIANVLFLNDGTGNFIAASNAGGAPGSSLGSGDAVTVADYDRDGFLDLFLTHGYGAAPFYNGPHQLYRNRGNGNRWLEVDLVGSASNRDAIGATVRVFAGGRYQSRFLDNGIHEKAQNFKRLHFGLGSNKVIDELQVVWPSGQVDTFYGVPSNRIIEIREAGDLAIVGTNGDDILKGAAGPDTIWGLGGNDTIDGKAGADTMEGRSGNDTFFVNHAGDLVVELAGGGSDTVRSSITYTLPANVEKLVLTGTANINGKGNAAKNTLTGNSGRNVLDGGSNADTMQGGQGNDTYKVDNAGDLVIELVNEGRDTVRSTISYTLPANVEHLTLMAPGAVNGAGNGLNNRITGFANDNALIGGGGNDTLDGGLGNDTLTGGSMRDRFQFSTALGAGNVDHCTDFNVPDDFIYLDNAVFTTLAVGTLPASALRIGASATLAAQRIIYNPANGALSYDADGSGTGAAVQFATLPSGLTPTNAKFMVY